MIRPFLSFACGALWCATCGPATAQEATPAGPLPGVIPDAPAPSLFDPAEAARQARDQEDARWLADFLDPHLADGFDFPVGNADGQGAYRSPDGKRFNGWYVATKFCESYWLGLHTGEDWNGNGGGDTDLGQEVRAIGNGRVVFAGPAAAPFGNIVVIEHRYLENHQLVRILSQYDHLREVKVAKDQRVKRRELIGTIGKGTDDQFPAHLHFEIRKESMAASAPEFWPSSNGWTEEMVRQNYEAPSEFVRAHRKLLHPATSDLLVLAVKHRHQLSVIRKGLVARTVEMALSQKPEGPKQAEGDLRTPEGAYRVNGQSLGPFDDQGWRRFLGAAWIRLDYPNAFDARAALAEGRLTQAQHDAVARSRPRGLMPPQDTPLGGGIGIHGWAGEGWDPSGDRSLTWGCLSLNKDDLLALYREVRKGTPVVIVP